MSYHDWVVARLGSSSEVDRLHRALAEMADTGKPVVFVGRPMSGKTTMLALVRAASGNRVAVFDNVGPRIVRLAHPAVYSISLGEDISRLFHFASVFELKPIRTAMDPAVREELLSSGELNYLREAFSVLAA